MSDAADRRERRPALSFAYGRAWPPKIYFLTPDHAVPAGGIRVIYRHVDILNAAGMNAFVLHRRPGFRCTWFDNDTKVAHVGAVSIRSGDVLVVPEIEADVLGSVPPGIRRVIFNQNSHLTWRREPGEIARHYAASPDLAAVACVSEHNQNMLRRAFPTSPIRRLHISIDPDVFRADDAPRARRIAYMPRRGQDDAVKVLAMLRGHKLLDGWEIVALSGLSHEEVAAELKRARIFLAFTRQEGFGLPAAEAMACGCYVIGNDGFGGREFFQSHYSSRVEAGDILGFVAAVEQALRGERTDPDWCEERGNRASRFVLQEYSPARERDDVVSLYAEILGLSHAAKAVQG